MAERGDIEVLERAYVAMVDRGILEIGSIENYGNFNSGSTELEVNMPILEAMENVLSGRLQNKSVEERHEMLKRVFEANHVKLAGKGNPFDLEVERRAKVFIPGSNDSEDFFPKVGNFSHLFFGGKK